jgi:hypothetical protein
VKPVEQHPGVGAAISPQRRANYGNQPEVLRRNVTNGVTRDAPGSLSCLIVPLKAGERVPSEPGSREGGGRVMEPLLGNMNDTQRSEHMCTVRQRIAQPVGSASQFEAALGPVGAFGRSESMTPKNRMRYVAKAKMWRRGPERLQLLGFPDFLRHILF